MPDSLNDERDRLRFSWDRYSETVLDSYLVSGVEDPRINPQSILTRALLCDALFPGRFSQLIEEELRFGFVMTWLLTHLQLGIEKRLLIAAIQDGDRRRCPDCVIDTYTLLQPSNGNTTDYVTRALEELDGSAPTQLAPAALDTFRERWQRRLSAVSCRRCSVFEPACGSANDFRYLATYGFARFLDFTAIDIASKNISNAHRRFPHVDFRVGDALDTSFESNVFDYAFVHDLFEHLSITAIEQAVREILRVVRREAWFHFFNAADIPQHEVQPVEQYHWNVISIREIVRVICETAAHVEVIPIAELAYRKYGLSRFHNAGAYTIVAVKVE